MGLGVLLGKSLEFCWVHGEFGVRVAPTSLCWPAESRHSHWGGRGACLDNLKSVVWRWYLKPGN